MTNKRKIEILEETLSKIQSGERAFICNAIKMSCEDLEYHSIRDWFESKKPNSNQYSDFLKNVYWKGSCSWWQDFEKEPRIRFLETLINELKQEIA